MAYLLGTDEAGYGPNFGPLLISGTLWRVADDSARRDLYDLLGDSVDRGEQLSAPDGPLSIADSKVLYRSKGRLRPLERGVLAALASLEKRPAGWLDAWRLLAPGSVSHLEDIPWYANFDRDLPLDEDPSAIDRVAGLFQEAQKRANVQLVTLRSVAIFPAELNRLIEQFDSKGTALSEQTLNLVAELTAPLGDEPIIVQCDKHGGRNRYAGLLQHVFADQVVQVLREGRSDSLYRWGPKTRPVELRFAAKGEAFLPAALASMASKYLRELAMIAFNAYWRRLVPGIRPTAGYPADARRFKKEILDQQRLLRIPDHVLWRMR
jgi:ribonuclease HII